MCACRAPAAAAELALLLLALATLLAGAQAVLSVNATREFIPSPLHRVLPACVLWRKADEIEPLIIIENTRV